MCRANGVPCDKVRVMSQWQCHVLLLNVKILNLVTVFVILSQFDLNVFKTKAISSLFKLRQNLTFI